MNNSVGDLIISMDSDLQHPPSTILEMITKYNEGYDVVNTTRRDRNNNIWKTNFIKLFYKILNMISGTNIQVSSLNFKLISRKFLNEFLQLKEVKRFDRGLIEWLGFKQCYIEYYAEDRYSGKTKYTFRRLVLRGIDSISSFSTKPLRLVFHISIVIFIISILIIVYTFIRYLIGEEKNLSFPLIIATILLGIQFLSIGIVSEYIGNIYNESKKRPSYIIKKITKEYE